MTKNYSNKLKKSEKSNKSDHEIIAFSKWDLAGIALIFCMALLFYYPAIHGSLIWNDASHVTPASLQSAHGLWRIWSEFGATPQYYPLLHSAFWLEHSLWGDSVLGYHLVNLLLHCLSAGLVFFIVRRLRLPGAWLAAMLFALHPVCVESVAWISEQKSALSGLFYLASGLVYLRFDEKRRKSAYFWASALFLFALLSKTVTATLPAALLVVLWWRNGKIAWKRDVLPLSPWLGAGIFAGLATAWIEKKYIGDQATEFVLSIVQRCMLAGRVVWFYISKLFWPSNLSFIYPRFTIDPKAWQQWVFPLGLLALFICLWIWRKPARGILAGMLFLVVTLFPVLGFFNVFPFTYSYVADHFQYLACLGIIIPFSAGASRLVMIRLKMFSTSNPKDNKAKLIPLAACMLFAAILGVLTWKQCGMYANMETLWRTTIARNPDSFLAYNNLSELLLSQERADEALAVSLKAVELKPDDAEANNNLGNIYRYKRKNQEAMACYQHALQFQPNVASYHAGLASVLIELGKTDEAMKHYQSALDLGSTDAFLMNNYAWILSTSPKSSSRDGKKAAALALMAIQIVGENEPTVRGTLAAALAELGKFDDAVIEEQRAYDLSILMGNKEQALWHMQLLGLYRSGKPYREMSTAGN